MNNFYIFENVFGEHIQKKLLEEVSTFSNFPWFFSENVQNQAKTDTNLTSGFRHCLWSDGNATSAWSNTFLPIIWKIEELTERKVTKIINMHVNLGINMGKKFNGMIHNDGFLNQETENEKRYTGIYYLENSDGNTVLYDDDKTAVETITPEADKLILFSSFINHTGALPTVSSYRRVVNLNILLEHNDSK